MRARRKRLELSSANELLRGFKFRGRGGQLHPITRVVKLGGARRRIHWRGGFENVDRATIHELAKLRGTLQYQRRLVAAPTRKLKRHYLKVSRDRQRLLLHRYMGRLEASLPHAPASVRRTIKAQLTHLRSIARTFGSPLIGETPATSVIPPHYGPHKTFSVAARTAVTFKTKRRRGRTYVVPWG